MKAKPDSSDSLVFECDLDEPPEKVWRALTEPELLEAWLGKDEPRGTDSEREILSAEPHRLLRYRWRDRESGDGDNAAWEVDSIVTVELSPRRAGGTHLRLTHGEFRIVSGVLRANADRVRPMTRARRRTAEPIYCAMPYLLRRAA
jgi:uncharacterized protein YndB with AHSA1/START domain